MLQSGERKIKVNQKDNKKEANYFEINHKSTVLSGHMFFFFFLEAPK